jgi:hypothetical protein
LKSYVQFIPLVSIASIAGSQPSAYQSRVAKRATAANPMPGTTITRTD